MELTCPNCGETIPAQHINIQEMVAVCPACNHLAQVSLPQAKAKRRKVKQPQYLTLRDEPHRLQMAFRTNFRLDRDTNFITASLQLVFSLVFLFTTLSSDLSTALPFLPFAAALWTLAAMYALSLIAYNETHIMMSDERLTVARGPVPNLLRQPRQIGLTGVEAIRFAETDISQRENYDTPRYNVWIEYVDGREERIATDLVGDYAAFITQKLNEHLHDEADTFVDTTRLQEQADEAAPLHALLSDETRHEKGQQ